MTSTAFVNPECPQTYGTPANQDDIIAVVEGRFRGKLVRYRAKIGNIPTKGRRYTLLRSIRPISIFSGCTTLSIWSFSMSNLRATTRRQLIDLLILPATSTVMFMSKTRSIRHMLCNLFNLYLTLTFRCRIFIFRRPRLCVF